METKPTSGLAGAAVRILGADLTGATRIGFNGTAAVFESGESQAQVRLDVIQDKPQPLTHR